MGSEWAAQFVGVPFVDKGRELTGCDCWGLVRLALARGFNLSVPDYSEQYATTTDREEIAALVRAESVHRWIEVDRSQAQPGDVVLFRIQGQVCHAGVVIAAPRFLHCQKQLGTVVERWDSPLWAKRVSSVIRHPSLVTA